MILPPEYWGRADAGNRMGTAAWVCRYMPGETIFIFPGLDQHLLEAACQGHGSGIISVDLVDIEGASSVWCPQVCRIWLNPGSRPGIPS